MMTTEQIIDAWRAKSWLSSPQSWRADRQDFYIMLACVRASGRGATPADVQRNVALFDLD